jgi:hypothetical protein
VTALGPDPGGKGDTLLRLWELAGVSGKITVNLPAGLKARKAASVNLRGEPAGNEIPVENGSFGFDLGAYQPASFVLH